MSNPAFNPTPIVSYAKGALSHKGRVVVVARWQGEYFEVRDAIEKVSPRLFTGSGTTLDGSKPIRDASFECKNMESAIRLMNKLLKWKLKYRKNTVDNFMLETFPS